MFPEWRQLVLFYSRDRKCFQIRSKGNHESGRAVCCGRISRRNIEAPRGLKPVRRVIPVLLLWNRIENYLFRIIFTSCITMVGSRARMQIQPICVLVRAAMPKAPAKSGIRRMTDRSAAPSTKAPMVYMLVRSPRRKMDWSPRELKPCHSRAKHKVAKAIVEAVSASVCSPI